MSEARIETSPLVGGATENLGTSPEANPGAAHGAHSAVAHNDNLKFAMWLFLASEVIIFVTLIAAYIIFSIQHREVVHEVHSARIDVLGFSIPSVFLVAFNTFLLLTSSWTMVMGLREAEHKNRKGAVQWLTYTAILGIIFLVFQYIEYGILASKGVVLNGTGELAEFGMRFYAPTALHGAHVLAGVIWALWVVRRASKGAYDSNPVGIELFGLYWHFVDVVWILIFTVIYLV
jgi:heme/copper-type cytochrome/quinol oxidase subunit 3